MNISLKDYLTGIDSLDPKMVVNIGLFPSLGEWYVFMTFGPMTLKDLLWQINDDIDDLKKYEPNKENDPVRIGGEFNGMNLERFSTFKELLEHMESATS